jgi:flagellar hook assembly protein FlgD
MDANVVFTLAQDERVDLSVYDVRGARVSTLRSGVFGAGRYSVRWDGTDESGRRLGGGMYFVRLNAGRYSRTVKTAIMP